MTSHVGRLYSLALALLVFFVLWVGIAAHPWASAGTDPRVAALVAREQQLRRDSVIVQKIVALAGPCTRCNSPRERRRSRPRSGARAD